jgi:dihydrolipoamide dehydrogenase
MVVLKKKIAIIGAGSAGMSAYRAAMEHTSDIVLIEEHRYGTMCARSGCMPSKLLITASDRAHQARTMGRFGIDAGPVTIDGAAVMKRVRDERDRFVGFVVDTVESWPAQNRLIGHARFIAPGTLQVGNDIVVEAERIVIATGSKPNIPAGWRETLGARLVVNEDLFQWDTLPGSVLVVGAGAIGLELAQSLVRLGVRVKLLSRGRRIGTLSDPRVSDMARELIKDELSFSEDVQDIAFVVTSGQVRAFWNEASGACQDSFDFVLAAMGRTPDIAGLDVAKADLALDTNGKLKVNRLTGQVGDAPVFLAGDAQGARALLHEAIDDGRGAGSNALNWPNVQPYPRRTPLAIVFTSPQIAMAGLSHAELTKAGTDFVIGDLDWSQQGRARIAAQHRGLLRVYADRATGSLLGAEMVGPQSEHLSHLLAWCIQMQLSVAQILAFPFYHPVFEEGVRTALRHALDQLEQAPAPTPVAVVAV